MDVGALPTCCMAPCSAAFLAVALGAGEPAGLSAVTGVAAHASLPDLGALLQQAAARLSRAALAGFVQTETEEDLDRRGKTTAVRMTKSAEIILPDGTRQEEVREALEDGYDVTGKIRKFREERLRRAQREGKPLMPDVGMELKVPFESSEQPHYRFQVVDADPMTLRVQFAPKGDPHRRWVGEATLDAETGTILSLQGKPAVLPHFIDEMKVEMAFAKDVPTGAMPALLRVEGAGHFLFFNKAMRYTAVSSDFRQSLFRPRE